MNIEALEKLDRDCAFTFPIMYAGWECDDVGWVMHDGRIFGTNHGIVCEMTVKRIEDRISETESCLAGLKRVLTVAKIKEQECQQEDPAG